MRTERSVVNKETLLKALSTGNEQVLDAFHVAMKRCNNLLEKQMIKESIELYGCRTFHEVEMSDCIDESIFFSTKRAARALIYLNTCIRKVTGEVMLNVFLREDDFRANEVIDEFLVETTFSSTRDIKVA